MCTSYKVGDIKMFEAFSEFPASRFEFKSEIYKDYPAPNSKVWLLISTKMQASARH